VNLHPLGSDPLRLSGHRAQLRGFGAWGRLRQCVRSFNGMPLL